MLTKWQFNVLFFVGVGGVVLLLIGPEVGLNINTNPTAIAGIGAILSYILTQKPALTKPKDKEPPPQNNTTNGEDDAVG